MLGGSMKKVAVIFTVAVFLPSLVLAWLALRSLRDQQLVLERQQALLYTTTADALSKEINSYLEELQRSFSLDVESLLLRQVPAEVVPAFDDRLRQHWPFADVGFVVSLDGRMLAPPLNGRAEARRFRAQNDLFLTSHESVEVYGNTQKTLSSVSAVGTPTAQVPADNPNAPAEPPDAGAGSNPGRNYRVQNVQRSVDPQQAAPGQQQIGQPGVDNRSRLLLAEAEFRQVMGDASQGTVARFLENQLNVMFWYRPRRDTNLVFGALVNLPRLTEELRPLIKAEPETLRPEICVALLDDTARPVARSEPAFQTNWKRPFVAAEIGETLPHWEVGIYLLDPNRLARSAQLLKVTLGLLISVLVVAIGVGSWLIVGDLRRQLRLARQKTDFVSNVSHELKTPLTSIRMFAELLAEGRVSDPGKQRSYLAIITAETARLTRLINNVLDFSRLERGEKRYQMARLDLVALVREILDSYRPHLEAAWFKLEGRLPPSPLFVHADHDALAQVLVNLLSNAEKYSGAHREITVEVRARGPHAEVWVRDRGLGVPPGCGEKIFEQFYRAHDALNSGVQGSGLGLTLARQVARAHGGDMLYEPREGGGSCFALCLPLAPEPPPVPPDLKGTDTSWNRPRS
jgi:signal transduction histidine kinase